MKSQHRLVLLGLALGVLLALLLAPQTRWLVRLQLLTSLRLYHPLPGPDTSFLTFSKTEDDRRVQAVAVRFPNDYDIQYARAVSASGSDQAIANLLALTARFGDRPALYAGILRYETIKNVHVNRMEENPKNFHSITIAPGDLAAYDQTAAAGERLDPNNAYFPLMRSIGLFAAHRDAEGLGAVTRASQKPIWQEYYTADIEARWRLHEEAYGDRSGLARTAISASLLLPELSQLRAAARFILHKAVQEERAGQPEEGLKLREALRRVGDLMRVHSTFYIGSLVAIAISGLATSDPGGVIPPRNSISGLTPEQSKQRHLNAFCAYVTRLGHPEAAARARAEEEAGRKVSALVRLNDLLASPSLPLSRLVTWWLVDLATLANILWLLIFGGVAAALTRTRWAHESAEGAGKYGKDGFNRKAVFKQSLVATGSVAIVFLLADFFIHIFALPNWLASIVRGVETLLFLIVVFALPPAIVIYFMRHGFRPLRFSRPDFLWGIGVALLAGVGLYGFCRLAAWQSGSLAEMADDLRLLIGTSGNSEDNAGGTTQIATKWFSIAAVLAVPFLLTVVLSIAARVRRVSVFFGLVHGFRSAALPAACVLLLVYGGLLLGTVRQDREVAVRVWHQVHDEGAYFAAQSGQAWPGPVP